MGGRGSGFDFVGDWDGDGLYGRGVDGGIEVVARGLYIRGYLAIADVRRRRQRAQSHPHTSLVLPVRCQTPIQPFMSSFAFL